MPEDKPDFLNQPLKEDDDFDISIKVKPKINVSKLLNDGELELKSLVVKAKVHKEFEDDVSVDFKFNADLKKETINSAELKFTKKF